MIFNDLLENFKLQQGQIVFESINLKMIDQDSQNYTQLELQLIQAINESLQNHIASNGTFLAQRLLAEKDNEETRSLLADCYMAENKHYKVFYILKECKSQMNRYKFALCCSKINKYKEAEKALLGGSDQSKTKNYDLVANGSYGLYLLGVICQKQTRYADARDYFMKALETNPTLWSAYEKLGKLGQHAMPGKIFNDLKMKNYQNSPKKLSTPLIKKRKQEEEKMKRTVPSVFPKRKNSIHSDSSNLMSLLKKFGDGYYNLCMYNCLQSIQQFKKLPQNQFNTAWVLTSIGRAYMQIVRYNEAVQYYQQAYKLQPYRIEGVQYYSSCLWHLKKQTDLAYLAHQSLEKSIYAPEAWIAVGNCLSLQKQHEQALKYFTRAIQLNPQNPYAHSLCGHQHVYNQDFIKAKRSFQQALNYDVRHYSAWWGLGNISYKQQKYDKAAQNFHKALGINNKNPVLYSFMGMTLAANRQFQQALKYFQKSQSLDPKNGLNRYQKANTLVKLQKYDEAVQQLETLQGMMPKQPPIPMLLGKIYKKLGKVDKAHYYFSIALDLQSKDAQKIKGFIESLHNNGNDGEQLDI